MADCTIRCLILGEDGAMLEKSLKFEIQGDFNEYESAGWPGFVGADACWVSTMSFNTAHINRTQCKAL